MVLDAVLPVGHGMEEDTCARMVALHASVHVVVEQGVPVGLHKDERWVGYLPYVNKRYMLTLHSTIETTTHAVNGATYMYKVIAYLHCICGRDRDRWAFQASISSLLCGKLQFSPLHDRRLSHKMNLLKGTSGTGRIRDGRVWTGSNFLDRGLNRTSTICAFL